MNQDILDNPGNINSNLKKFIDYYKLIEKEERIPKYIFPDSIKLKLTESFATGPEAND